MDGAVSSEGREGRESRRHASTAAQAQQSSGAGGMHTLSLTASGSRAHAEPHPSLSQ